MSQENVEVVPRAFAAFNRQDADGLIALCDPDVEFEPIMAVVDGMTYQGPDGVRKWIAEMNEMFEDYHAEYDEIEDLGEIVVVRGTTSGRGRGSGVPTERPWTLGVRFRRGKVRFWTFRQSREEALEAVGLRE
jgi:ketosteroid isomerase-like protein